MKPTREQVQKALHELLCTGRHVETGIYRWLLDEGLPALEELDRYQRWVRDIQSGMYINCVYCGHRYGPQHTAPAQEILTAHIEQCPKHPMSAIKTENARLREALEWYAAEDNYYSNHRDGEPISGDAGRRAREALGRT